MAEGGITGDGPDSHIIAGVIDGMRQSFIDSGVDLDVLAKLENLWVSKLCSSSSAGLAMADVMVPGIYSIFYVLLTYKYITKSEVLRKFPRSKSHKLQPKHSQHPPKARQLGCGVTSPPPKRVGVHTWALWW